MLIQIIYVTLLSTQSYKASGILTVNWPRTVSIAAKCDTKSGSELLVKLVNYHTKQIFHPFSVYLQPGNDASTSMTLPIGKWYLEISGKTKGAIGVATYGLNFILLSPYPL
ncbi:hypothetical protein ACFQZ1_15205 [Bacillus sp. CGMCC 1.60114]|uniref:hypothetical protein n=1 Tax=unclassified Bacillus (in: firmicutes) TaxID=185979 RepID=UPI003628C37C